MRNPDKYAPIKNVYMQYKHLDILLSDKEWMGEMTPQHQCLYDLWQAIKQAVMEAQK